MRQPRPIRRDRRSLGGLPYDLDIRYSRTSGNLRRLAQALAPFHPKPRGFPDGIPFLWDETTLRNGSIFTLQTGIGEIHFLAEVAGLGVFDDVGKHAMTVEAFGRELLTLDLPGLNQRRRSPGSAGEAAAV